MSAMNSGRPTHSESLNCKLTVSNESILGMQNCTLYRASLRFPSTMYGTKENEQDKIKTDYLSSMV